MFPTVLGLVASLSLVCASVLSIDLAHAKLLDDVSGAPTSSATWTGGVDSESSDSPMEPPESGNIASQERNEKAWSASGRLGYATFLRARSIAFEHRFKPGLKLSLSKPVDEAWELGGALSGVLDTDSNYGVWAGYAVGRYSLGSDAFRAGASLGVGVGYDAPILHSDLEAEAAVSPYAMLALDAVWKVADDVWLGAELSDEQLSVVYLGVALRWEL